MISGKSVLAIIPAREGSKRVPLKNLTIYRGKPLIQWAIDHALGSKYIDNIIISSDSQAILQYARRPVVPLLRPSFLASDHATSEAVIAHAIYDAEFHGQYCGGGDELPDLFVLLQPTSPLRLPSDIDATLELAVKVGHTAISVDPQGLRNGAVYAFHTTQFLAKLNIDAAAAHYTMPADRSLDIDYPEDFNR